MFHRYLIIESKDINDVTWRVGAHLDVGYELVGGVSTVVDPTDQKILYSQAVCWKGHPGDTIPDPYSF